ncbi:hypothetical protein O7M46_08020, partial [Bisgaard Taxon 45]|nr:hypothetical protein [Bisgaard Taxon 45]
LEVKRCNADGSVGFPHVRVGHRQVLIIRAGRPQVAILGVFLFWVFLVFPHQLSYRCCRAIYS